MSKNAITKQTLNFLQDLANHNDRPWFEANRSRYESSFEDVQNFVASLVSEMKKHDNIVEKPPKKHLQRIYRDIRFSKDKTPYKSWWAGGMARDTDWLRGGYYFHIGYDRAYAAGGFYNPNPDDLRLIRDHIAQDSKPLSAIVHSSLFKNTFGTLLGEQLKNVPRGYDNENEGADFLKYKQFLVSREFSTEEILGDDFIERMVETYRAMRPFFDYMSDILTHNLNGEPIY